jgi:hypothetical protein
MTALIHKDHITTSCLFLQGNLDQLIAVRSTNAMVSGAGRFVTVTVDNEGLHNSYIPRNCNGTDSISERSPSISEFRLFCVLKIPSKFAKSPNGLHCGTVQEYSPNRL